MKSYEELKALIEQRGVHNVFGAAGEGWFIEQNAEELATFLLAMQALGVESVLEIGTGYRAGLARFLHDDMGWTVTSVDIHAYGHQFSGITFVNPVPPTSMAFNVADFTSYDLVMIDADHSYEGVRNDHRLWGEHATKVIAFHDIAGLRDCEGVKQYWQEIAYYDGYHLKPGYREIIAEGEQRGGIGYIVLAEVAADQHVVEHTDIPGITVVDDNGTPTIQMPAKQAVRPKPAAKKPAARKAAVKK